MSLLEITQKRLKISPPSHSYKRPRSCEKPKSMLDLPCEDISSDEDFHKPESSAIQQEKHEKIIKHNPILSDLKDLIEDISSSSDLEPEPGEISN